MSKLNEKQRKVFDIVVTAIQILAVVFSVIISIIVIANPSVKTNDVGQGKLKLLPVLTDSMKGDKADNFSAGDMVIATSLPDKLTDLQIGQIITYLGYANGQSDQLVTHRIVAYAMSNLDENDPVILATQYTSSYFSDGVLQYCFCTNSDLIKNADGTFKLNYNGVSYEQCIDGFYTRNDYPASTAPDLNTLRLESELVNFGNIKALYKSHIKGVGKAINWLQEATHFLLVIVLPLALLFIYNLVLFIQMIMQAKVASEKERLAAEGYGPAVIDEEEIRRRAIAEYLASQQLNKEQQNTDADNTVNSQSDKE